MKAVIPVVLGIVAIFLVSGCTTAGDAIKADFPEQECPECSERTECPELNCSGCPREIVIIEKDCPEPDTSVRIELQQPKITVSRVIDGDSIELSDGNEVRLIGINAPEAGEPCYTEASEGLERLVSGKTVELKKDVSETDQYGRMLRYVYVYDVFVNLHMVKEGLAIAYDYPPDIMHSGEFRQAENEAKNSQKCVWKKSTRRYVEDECFHVTEFHYDAAGNDNDNLNDEYVRIGSRCSYPIDMTGWTIKDNTASHIYHFPSFVLAGQSSFTLYSGIGTNTRSDLHWQKTNYAIWNNGGDTLYLRDNTGDLVFTHSY